MQFSMRKIIPECETTVARRRCLQEATLRDFTDFYVADDDGPLATACNKFYFIFEEFTVGYDCRNNKCWVVSGNADRATRANVYKIVRGIANV